MDEVSKIIIGLLLLILLHRIILQAFIAFCMVPILLIAVIGWVITEIIERLRG